MYLLRSLLLIEIVERLACGMWTDALRTQGAAIDIMSCKLISMLVGRLLLLLF